MVKRYLFRDEEGSTSLKSILIRSNGWAALTRCKLDCLWKFVLICCIFGNWLPLWGFLQLSMASFNFKQSVSFGLHLGDRDSFNVNSLFFGRVAQHVRVRVSAASVSLFLRGTEYQNWKMKDWFACAEFFHFLFPHHFAHQIWIAQISDFFFTN